ncbi:hypothetical protein AB0G67_03955 [Streptomyces sp. NPDC021056]|uniref:hypothetical protein n=1 Tax=Streptomyces sp. NPDC021056 TaxID=3155012 RepID=UPI0033DA17BD
MLFWSPRDAESARSWAIGSSEPEDGSPSRVGTKTLSAPNSRSLCRRATAKVVTTSWRSARSVDSGRREAARAARIETGGTALAEP